MNNTLPIVDITDNETGCCPKFHAEDWDGLEVKLDQEQFVKVETKSLFFIPLNMGKVMQKVQTAIQENGAEDKDRYLMLSKDMSPFKAQHYIKVSKPVPGYETKSILGTFQTKVYDAEYRELPKLIKKFDQELTENGHHVLDRYAFYTTCPNCAKHYGHNYIVLFHKISD